MTAPESATMPESFVEAGELGQTARCHIYIGRNKVDRTPLVITDADGRVPPEEIDRALDDCGSPAVRRRRGDAPGWYWANNRRQFVSLTETWSATGYSRITIRLERIQ